MKKSDVVCVLGSVYAAATAFFYCWPMWFKWLQLPRYYPVEHVWRIGKTEGAISQGWYGMQVFAYIAAGVVTLGGYFVLKAKAKGDLKPATIKAIGIATWIIVAVCMGYIMFHEYSKWEIL